MTWVPRDTKTRPVPGFGSQVVGASESADVVLGDFEGLRLPSAGQCQRGGEQKC